MDNSKHIEEVKNFIAMLKEDIEIAIGFWGKSASLRLPLAQKWLELLITDEITQSEVENLAEQAFNIENIDKIWGWYGSHLFWYMRNWSEEAKMKSTKIKSWSENLWVLDFITYYERWTEFDGDGYIKQAGLAISKRWLELVNSSSATQYDIDSIMNELFSPKEFWGSGWSGMTYEFRDWAEANGFDVRSEKQVREHYDLIFHNMLLKVREENGRKNEG